jgi:hypothetical protein
MMTRRVACAGGRPGSPRAWLPDAVVSDIEILAGPPATLFAATYRRSISSIELPAAPATEPTELRIDDVLVTEERTAPN